MQGNKKSVQSSGSNFSQALNVAKQVKQTMKDFYKHQDSSAVDFQNMIKDRGFKFLNSNVEERETIVALEHAQQIVNDYIASIREVLGAGSKLAVLLTTFFTRWSIVKVDKFKKLQILFSDNTTSNASFVGAYFKRTRQELYLCYKVVKHAFKLAPDIYVVHQTESDSIFWGAYSSSSKRDVLQEMTRGFKKQDLAVLMEIASVSLLDASIINELQ